MICCLVLPSASRFVGSCACWHFCWAAAQYSGTLLLCPKCNEFMPTVPSAYYPAHTRVTRRPCLPALAPFTHHLVPEPHSAPLSTRASLLRPSTRQPSTRSCQSSIRACHGSSLPPARTLCGPFAAGPSDKIMWRLNAQHPNPSRPCPFNRPPSKHTNYHTNIWTPHPATPCYSSSIGRWETT